MKLSLIYPVNPVFINQGFGDTTYLDFYKANGLIFPGHNGIDFQASHGEPIYAAHDGGAYYETDDKQGHGVVLISSDYYDYNGTQCKFKTIYWHMCDSTKEPKYTSPVEKYRDLNQAPLIVKQGDLIGYADSTGLSTGDHLHFGLKPVAVDEAPWTVSNIEAGNGYYGAIDPKPFLPPLPDRYPAPPITPVVPSKPTELVIPTVSTSTPIFDLIEVSTVKVKKTWLSTVLDFILSLINAILK